MVNSQLLSMSSSFNCLPNEVVLIIWTYLGHVEAIRIFEPMKCQRYTCLLEKYCYESVNFRETSLSTFQLYCSHLFMKIRLHVQTLKLGHRTSYSQLRIFTQMHPASLLLSNIFPKLRTLVLYNIPKMSCDDLKPYLILIPSIKHLTINKCALKEASSLICSNLLAHKTTSQLESCFLYERNNMNGIVLHEPIPSSYQVQQSLIHLRIHMQDFVSLKNLLQFLPKLLILDVHISSDIAINDNDLFANCICPCIDLRKLFIRIHMIVQNFENVVNFILLFRDSIVQLNLAILHKDLSYRHSLIYIDGNVLFNKLLIHMIKLEKINFCIETACLCDQQMDSIIKSFQTEYWLSMLIGCHYDKMNGFYVIFSLPYAFSDYIVITTDIINTQFNQSKYQLNDLISLLFTKTYVISLRIGEKEKLSSSFINWLKQGNYRGHTLRIASYGYYQLEQNEKHLLLFDRLDLVPTIENHLKTELINPTMIWLNWMPYLRTLDIDTQMLSKLVSTINLNGTIDRFSYLEKLIVRQADPTPDDDTLTIIARLGASSSLKDICVLDYKMLNFKSIDDQHFYLTIFQICCNMSNLETMTIRYAKPNPSINDIMLEELSGTNEKDCKFECIYVSDDFIQFWIEK